MPIMPVPPRSTVDARAPQSSDSLIKPCIDIFVDIPRYVGTDQLPASDPPDVKELAVVTVRRRKARNCKVN